MARSFFLIKKEGGALILRITVDAKVNQRAEGAREHARVTRESSGSGGREMRVGGLGDTCFNSEDMAYTDY